MKDKVLMEDMSWLEIKEAMEAGKDTAIVLVGAIAQHGPHLPTSTCTLMGYAWGERIARKLGNALVAPVIRPTCSSFHMAFPGTISLRVETLLEVIRDYCESLAAHGFKTIILIPSMGSSAQIDSIAPQLARSLRQVRIVTFTEIQSGLFPKWIEIAKRDGITPEELGSHAGDGETSIILATRPDLVDMAKAEKGFLSDKRTPKPQVMQIMGIDSVSSIGVDGDPRKATSERGMLYLEELTDYIASEIKKKLSFMSKRSYRGDL